MSEANTLDSQSYFTGLNERNVCRFGGNHQDRVASVGLMVEILVTGRVALSRTTLYPYVIGGGHQVNSK